MLAYLRGRISENPECVSEIIKYYQKKSNKYQEKIEDCKKGINIGWKGVVTHNPNTYHSNIMSEDMMNCISQTEREMSSYKRKKKIIDLQLISLKKHLNKLNGSQRTLDSLLSN